MVDVAEQVTTRRWRKRRRRGAMRGGVGGDKRVVRMG